MPMLQVLLKDFSSAVSQSDVDQTRSAYRLRYGRTVLEPKVAERTLMACRALAAKKACEMIIQAGHRAIVVGQGTKLTVVMVERSSSVVADMRAMSLHAYSTPVERWSHPSEYERPLTFRFASGDYLPHISKANAERLKVCWTRGNYHHSSPGFELTCLHTEFDFVLQIAVDAFLNKTVSHPAMDRPIAASGRGYAWTKNGMAAMDTWTNWNRAERAYRDILRTVNAVHNL